MTAMTWHPAPADRDPLTGDPDAPEVRALLELIRPEALTFTRDVWSSDPDRTTRRGII